MPLTVTELDCHVDLVISMIHESGRVGKCRPCLWGEIVSLARAYLYVGAARFALLEWNMSYGTHN